MAKPSAKGPSWSCSSVWRSDAVRRLFLMSILALILGGCHVRPDRHDTSPTQPLPDFDSQWDYSDPAGTESVFREILAATADRADASYRAQLLTQIARTQGLQRQFEAAHATLDDVEAMLVDDMPTAQVRHLLERGRVFNSAGDVARARPCFAEAWRLARRSELDGYAVDAAHMLGIVESGEESMRWNFQAMQLAENSDEPRARRWRGSLHNNIGWAYHEHGDYDGALTHFKRALVIRLQEGSKESIRIARWCVARCLRSLGRVEEALQIQRELEQELAGLESSDGYVPEEIAECLFALGRAEEAKPYFAQAHERLRNDPWLAEREPERLRRLRDLAGLTNEAKD
jgi:tetratricopeptide (TPR) repeat protein